MNSVKIFTTSLAKNATKMIKKKKTCELFTRG